jgi:methyl-accepting chemotaxis protein
MFIKQLILLAFIPSICLANTQDVANDQANKKSLDIIARIPRYGGDSELDMDDFTDTQYTYVIGVISLVVVPLALVALSILLCPIFALCRVCNCCCCKKKKPKNKITKKQIYMPYFVVLLCAIIMVIMVGIAYAANIDFSGALLYNSGEGKDSNLFQVAEDLVINAAGTIDTFSTIIISLKAGISYVVAGVQLLLSNTAVLGSGASSLIVMLSDISLLWNNYTISTQYNNVLYSFPCEFCTTISSSVSSITVQIEDQTSAIFEDLNNTINEVDSSLIDVEADILENIDNFIDSINDVKSNLDDIQSELTNTKPEIEDFNDKRELLYNILFGIPLLPIIFILFGGILKKPICFTLSYICLWFSCTLMFLLLTMHLPIAILLNDSCDFISIVDQNVTNFVNNTGGEVFQSCLDNSKLIIALGLGESLNFTNQIEFPSLGNISEDFTFSDLTSFETDTAATDFTTFYANGDRALNGINNLTLYSANGGIQHVYTRENVSNLNTTYYYVFNSPGQIALADLIDVIMAEQISINAFNDTLNKIRANLSSVSSQVSIIEADVQTLVDRVDNASYLLEPLFATVDQIVDQARCGFIGYAYQDTKDVMCSAVLGSLSRIVVSMFIVGILSILSCCISIKLVREVEWWQTQKLEEKELKLQQSFQPNKPSIIVMQPTMPNVPYQSGGVQPQNVYFNSQNV